MKIPLVPFKRKLHSCQKALFTNRDLLKSMWHNGTYYEIYQRWFLNINYVTVKNQCSHIATYWYLRDMFVYFWKIPSAHFTCKHCIHKNRCSQITLYWDRCNIYVYLNEDTNGIHYMRHESHYKCYVHMWSFAEKSHM